MIVKKVVLKVGKENTWKSNDIYILLTSSLEEHVWKPFLLHASFDVALLQLWHLNSASELFLEVRNI